MIPKEHLHSQMYVIKTCNSILDKLENKTIITDEEFNMILSALSLYLIAPALLGDKYDEVMGKAYKGIKNNDGNYPKWDN